MQTRNCGRRACMCVRERERDCYVMNECVCVFASVDESAVGHVKTILSIFPMCGRQCVCA